MVKNNQKRIKNGGYVNEDTKEIKSLIIIIGIVILLSVGLYFVTDRIINKESETTSTEFDYTIATVGTMFNRPYEDYYVFLYDSTSDEASQYKTLISNNEEKDDAKKVYFVDLSLKINSEYVKDKSNKKATNPSEVAINKSALVHIENGKITEYFESTSDYEKVLN